MSGIDSRTSSGTSTPRCSPRSPRSSRFSDQQQPTAAADLAAAAASAAAAAAAITAITSKATTTAPTRTTAFVGMRLTLLNTAPAAAGDNSCNPAAPAPAAAATATEHLYGTPASVSSDPAVAAAADVIVLAVPSLAHGEYLAALRPHLRPGAVIIAMPARSGGDLLFSTALAERAADCCFVGCDTLPWACRFTEWGKAVCILGTKASIRAAVTPPRATPAALGVLQALLGARTRVVGCGSNLAISLRNPGQVGLGLGGAWAGR